MKATTPTYYCPTCAAPHLLTDPCQHIDISASALERVRVAFGGGQQVSKTAGAIAPLTAALLASFRFEAEAERNSGSDDRSQAFAGASLALLDEIDRLKKLSGAEQWRDTLERALNTMRTRNIEARNLIGVLQQYATSDDLRRRIRRWLEGDAPAESREQIGGAVVSSRGSHVR